MGVQAQRPGCGDSYDVVHLMDGRIFVSIGDVSGNGLEAAVVGVVRQILRGICATPRQPALILDAADHALRFELPGHHSLRLGHRTFYLPEGARSGDGMLIGMKTVGAGLFGGCKALVQMQGSF
jgi:hypothetical protein